MSMAMMEIDEEDKKDRYLDVEDIKKKHKDRDIEGDGKHKDRDEDDKKCIFSPNLHLFLVSLPVLSSSPQRSVIASSSRLCRSPGWVCP